MRNFRGRGVSVPAQAPAGFCAGRARGLLDGLPLRGRPARGRKRRRRLSDPRGTRRSLRASTGRFPTAFRPGPPLRPQILFHAKTHSKNDFPRAKPPDAKYMLVSLEQEKPGGRSGDGPWLSRGRHQRANAWRCDVLQRGRSRPANAARMSQDGLRLRYAPLLKDRGYVGRFDYVMTSPPPRLIFERKKRRSKTPSLGTTSTARCR